MAKTRLLNAVSANFASLEHALGEVKDRMDKYEPVTGQDRVRIQETFNATMAAVRAMRAHLADLERRENNPKVTDRLRNLKNVFKDKAELSRKRQEVRDVFAKIEAEIKVAQGQVIDALEGIQFETVRLK